MIAVALPGHADAHLVVGAADPGELRGVELGALVAEQRIEGDAAADRAHLGAVLGGGVVEPVGEAKRAGALHVLGHHGRGRRDVAAKEAGDHARIDVVAASDAVADLHIDVAALVEGGRILGMGDRHGKQGDRKRGAHESADTHFSSSLGKPARSPRMTSLSDYNTGNRGFDPGDLGSRVHSVDEVMSKGQQALLPPHRVKGAKFVAV